MINPDGTAQCDRCGRDLPGFGVGFGMIVIDLGEDGEARQKIFCYGDPETAADSCRDVILAAAE